MKLSDALLGGAAIILGLAAFAQAQTFPRMPDGTPGPGLFPQILGILLALVGAVVVLQSMRPHEGQDQGYTHDTLVRAGLVLVAIAFYIAAVQSLGFLITAMVVTGGLMLILGVRVRVAVPTTIVLVFASMMLFERILRVPLPIGLWGG